MANLYYEMLFHVKVVFGKNFIKVEGDEIIIGLTSKPLRGKANLELIRKLSKYFKVSRDSVRIVSGFKSRRKVVEVLLNDKFHSVGN
ncbi:MAG TPA: DUF167 domain-containing protein [Candidatus Bathyarchaeota archaeon]|nr:DUF167 domain-containing protein [Candidatus Bathyarchaeota archaeon]